MNMNWKDVSQPAGQSFWGMQHVFAMFVDNLAPILVIGGSGGQIKKVDVIRTRDL